MARPRGIHYDLDDLVRRYQAGESALSIGRSYNVGSVSITFQLKKLGIPIRNNRDAALWRIMHEGPNAYMRGMRAAHRKIDGRAQPWVQGLARARTREIKQIGIRESEQRLAGYLRELGYEVTHQKAIDIYNIDLWLPESEIAVEVYLSGRAQLDSPLNSRRLIDLAYRGVTIVYVLATKTRNIDARAAQYIATFSQLTQRNPTLRGEYRVIRGTGQLLATGRDNFDVWPFIPTPIHASDRTGEADRRRII
jgi:hypothetical protein